MSHSQIRQIAVRGIRTLLILAVVVGVERSPAAAQAAGENLVGRPAELSAWAYAYRADRKVQDSPEAYLVLRRLERLDQAYRPLSLLLSQESEKKQVPKPPYSFLLSCQTIGEQGAMLPPPAGVLQSALLWEGRMRLNRMELHWPANDGAAAAKRRSPSVSLALRMVRLATRSAGHGPPKISSDGSTWVYNGDWNDVDMVAVFVRPAGKKTPRNRENRRSANPDLRSRKVGANGPGSRMGIQRRNGNCRFRWTGRGFLWIGKQRNAFER